MTAKRWGITGAVLSALLLGPARALAAACDRACLEGIMSDYLGALSAHNASRLQTTPDVLYVENSQVVGVGTGEWLVAREPGRYRHVFADPQGGQVGTITTLVENGVRAIYIARLKVEGDGRVSEIETQITRDAGGAALYENMTQPEPVWLEAVSEEQRIPRAEIIAQTNKYYTGMQRNDPRGNYSFFDKDCNRLEDALQTTNMRSGDAYGHSNDTVFASLGCEAQFQTGFLGFVTRIRARRFPVIDEERQAVLAFTTLDHNGTVRTLPEVNGTSSVIPPYFDIPRTLQAAEGFRLHRDKLFRIEMTLTEVPYGMRSPFPIDAALDGVVTKNPSLSANASNASNTSTPSALADPCDRVCLQDAVKKVLKSLIAHDASVLPLAEDVRYSENGQFLAVGDGLWETLGHAAQAGGDGGNDEYAAILADPESSTAAYWGASREQSTPGVLALRVRVWGGKISEIEAVDVRAETVGSRGGTMTLMRPPLPVEWDGTGLGRLDAAFSANGSDAAAVKIPKTLVPAYWDGLEKHSSAGVPFASSGCLRRDNARQSNLSCAAQADGKGAAPNGLFKSTTRVRDRRVLVEDAHKGVILAVAMVDNPAVFSNASAARVTERIPGTYMVPQLVKVVNGTITRVEGMVKWMPYGYTSAWSENGTASNRTMH